MDRLPVYELRINEDSDFVVDAIALVDEPAIESDFLAFAKMEKEVRFATDDSKMELLGAAMIPNMRIYRRDDESGEEYEVYFTKETIRTISQVFFKKGFQMNLNLDHTETTAKSFVFQSFIVDQSKGINSPKGLNLPDGSWVIGVKVQDKNVWNSIKGGNQKGFSIEGMFEFFETQKFQSVDESKQDEEILQSLQLLNNMLKHTKK